MTTPVPPTPQTLARLAVSREIMARVARHESTWGAVSAVAARLGITPGHLARLGRVAGIEPEVPLLVRLAHEAGYVATVDRQTGAVTIDAIA